MGATQLAGKQPKMTANGTMDTDNESDPTDMTHEQIKKIIYDINQTSNSNYDKKIDQTSNIESEKSNLNTDEITEIYKHTDKGPFHVIIEKEDIDPIEIGFKLTALKSNQVISVTKINKNKARVQTKTYDSANKLISRKAMSGLLEYKVYLPPNYVFSAGIIRNIPVKYSTDEIHRNITSNVRVETVERLTMWDNTTKTANPSTTVKLVFRSQMIPEKVYLAYNPIKVDLYIQRPLFCRNCLSYGHARSKCASKTSLCVNCSEKKHENGIACKTACKFCKVSNPNASDHRSSASICPTYQFQLSIKKIMTTKRLTFREAKEELLRQNPPAAKQNYPPLQYLFSQVLSNQHEPNTNNKIATTTFATQTPAKLTKTETSNKNDEVYLQLILKLVNILQSSSNNGSNDSVVLRVLQQTLYRYTEEKQLFNQMDFESNAITSELNATSNLQDEEEIEEQL